MLSSEVFVLWSATLSFVDVGLDFVFMGTYCSMDGTCAGVVMGSVVRLLERGCVGGCRIGPVSIQFKISKTEEKCSSPYGSCLYMSV